MKTRKHDAMVLSSNSEKDVFEQFTRLMMTSPVPDDELLPNLGMFLTSKNLARLLFFYELYKKIVTHHGIIVECGVRWGQTLSLMSALRGILEPFNRHRKIVGFDTFSGFVGTGGKDGSRHACRDGSFSVSGDYETYLDQLLHLQEQMNPMSHIKRYEIVKGDARKTVKKYFTANPQSIVSLAIFDFDIYAPTRAALEAIKPHLTKGSILVFDELSDDIFPGETVALKEVFDLSRLKVQRMPMTSRISYVEIE